MAPPPGAALEVDALSHTYGERRALDTLSLAVGAGEILGLLGPNGSGKSTVFRILSTLITPTSGTVRVFGDDVRSAPARVRRAMGVVFQSAALDPLLTVDENLRHHGLLYGLHGTPLAARATAVLDALGLADRRRDLVRTRSGGLARRVEVAKALLSAPRLLVLDEPSTGLDPAARRDLWSVLVRLRAEFGTTIVLTTHLMDEAAACDRVALLDQGRLVALGTPGELTAVVGGDVLWLASPSPETLAETISARFGLHAGVVDGRIRIERERAHELVAEVVEAFPGQIDSVTMTRPSLDDVFVHLTGRRFD
jgi:ABC-2 type transport system ATP-binding protein